MAKGEALAVSYRQTIFRFFIPMLVVACIATQEMRLPTSRLWSQMQRAWEKGVNMTRTRLDAELPPSLIWDREKQKVAAGLHCRSRPMEKRCPQCSQPPPRHQPGGIKALSRECWEVAAASGLPMRRSSFLAVRMCWAGAEAQQILQRLRPMLEEWRFPTSP